MDVPGGIHKAYTGQVGTSPPVIPTGRNDRTTGKWVACRKRGELMRSAASLSMPAKPVVLIVAMDDEFGIGCAGRMAWHIPGEMRFQARTTRSTIDESKMNALVMGRRTYESLPENRRPLTGRISIVVTTSAQGEVGVLVAPNLDAAIMMAQRHPDVETTYIYGGAEIYAQALARRIPSTLIVSRIPGRYDCDAFLPLIPESYLLRSRREQNYDGIIVTHEAYELVSDASKGEK